MNVAQKPALDTTVSLRPDKGNWVAIIFFAMTGIAPVVLMATGVLPPKSASDWLSVELMAGVILILTIPFAIWQAKAVVIAEETGLRWRGMGGWRTAEWVEVSDYYDQILTAPKLSLTVETKRDRLRLNPGLWTATPELKERIVQKATQAQAKEWGILGMRPETDWPRVFHYDTSDNRSRRIFLPIVLILMASYLVWTAALSTTRAAATLGSGWGWATFAIDCFGILPLGLFVMVVSRLQSATHRRRYQRLTLTRESVLYEDERGKIEASWKDILDLHLARGPDLYGRYVVVTKQGTFDFSPTIKESTVLRRAFPKFAAALPKSEWHSPESDALGGLSARWSSGCEGIGKRIYHYRTRMNRALLWFPTALVLITGIVQWIKASLGMATGSIWDLSSFGAMAFWVWWRYSTAAIETDSEGITQRTVLGKQHLAWAEITDYYQSGDDPFNFGIVKGKNARLWFWMSIVDVEDLTSEISRLAVNSRHQNWDKDTRNK